MPANQNLNSALNDIKNAKNLMQRAWHDTQNNHYISAAINELNKAESKIIAALQAISDEQ
ncbi:MAG: hypothetical protein CMJ19_06715 [Phycisphaeraceae bacterium]|nr:hypothetical protein [Phycisphaeraceae bacterium]